jgi:hypothetical protein
MRPREVLDRQRAVVREHDAETELVEVGNDACGDRAVGVRECGRKIVPIVLLHFPRTITQGVQCNSGGRLVGRRPSRYRPALSRTVPGIVLDPSDIVLKPARIVPRFLC